MSQHEINFRISRYINNLIGVAFLFALLAIVQHKDASDDQAASAHVQQQARQSAQADTWARVEGK